MLKFTLVMGLPTKAKHDWAKEYAINHNAEYLGLNANDLLLPHLEEILASLREGKSIVCDAVGFNLEDRMTLIDEMISATDDLIVEWNCIFVPCFVTNDLNDYEELLPILRTFQSPNLQEGWDNLDCAKIYTQEEIEKYEDLLTTMASNCILPNGKTLKKHLAEAAQYVLGHSCYVADFRAAKWHDIGKIFSYEGHANISAYLWLHTVKGMLGWLDGTINKKESLFVATAITFHTLVYNYPNEEEWQKAFLDLGFDKNLFAALLALYNANKKINK